MVLPAITPGDRGKYERTLCGVYTKRVRLSLLDRQGDVIMDLTRGFQDGNVTIDRGQDVDRRLDLTLLDPRHRLGFDADTYQSGRLDLTRMMRVWWIVDGPEMSRHVSVPVFTGPVTRAQRDGALVTLEAQGKEMYGLTPTRRTLTIRKGARRTDAIKLILRERMGETRLGHIPDLPARLPHDVVVGPNDKPWKKAQRLARSLNRQLFYAGNGVPYLRPWPGKPSWAFRSGPYGSLTSPVATSADLREVKNHIRVIGATPKGKKKPVQAHATADRWHPLSPWKLGPPGAPMWLIDEVHNDNLRTEKECREHAGWLLQRRLRLIHETSFDAAPVPHLDPGDLVRVDTEYESATTRVETLTLPLGLGADMSIGYVDPYKIRAPKPKKGRGR